MEWRALTVSLIDLLADEIRKILNKDPSKLSLSQILEGGTWLAGRKIAREKRHNLTSPIQINLSGTIF